MGRVGNGRPENAQAKNTTECRIGTCASKTYYTFLYSNYTSISLAYRSAQHTKSTFKKDPTKNETQQKEPFRKPEKNLRYMENKH